MVATPTTSARASPRQLASSTPTDPALLPVSGAKQPSRHSPLARSFSQFSYMPEPYERVEKTRREMATRRSTALAAKTPPGASPEPRYSTMRPLQDMELSQLAQTLAAQEQTLRESEDDGGELS